MSFTMFHHESAREQRLKNWTVISDVIKEIRRLHPGFPSAAIPGTTECRRTTRPSFVRMASTTATPTTGTCTSTGTTTISSRSSTASSANGSTGRRARIPDRPYFGQEVSTGYPNNDDGHFCRKYLFRHYVPQAFYGDWAWEDHDPLPGSAAACLHDEGTCGDDPAHLARNAPDCCSLPMSAGSRMCSGTTGSRRIPSMMQ